VKGLGIFFLSLSLLLSFECNAAQNETQMMTYDVYAGGIHALDASLTITTNAKNYDTELNSATHGFLHTLAPWSGMFSAKGNVGENGTPYPLEHVSSSTWKKETEEKQYTYDGKGHFLSYKVTETEDGNVKDKTPDKVDPDLTKDTTDILSATLNLLMMLPEKPECSGESLIFDGDRNFKLAFKDAGAVLYEPIMRVEVIVPEANMGDVLGDMNTRRARVQGMNTEKGRSVVTATVPLAEMLRYTTTLRSMTGGRGHFSMEFDHYDLVPTHLAQEIIDARQKELKEEE